MTNGDIAAAAGITIIVVTRDVRLGPSDINKTLDQLVLLIDAVRDDAPNTKNVFASNIEAKYPTAPGGATESVQTYLETLNGRNAANISATGPSGEASTIQSVLNLLMGV